MDQIKIGKFIAKSRKSKNLTQAQLAEKLGITDRAVSKWETGKAMPDTAIMLELCDLLHITVNDLLNGEKISMDNYKEKTNELLMEFAKEKEKSDKRLLFVEVIMGVICMLVLFALTLVASLVTMEEWLRTTLILIGLAPILIASPFMLKIEQVAGYYECQHCKHKYVPSFKSVNLAMHFGRTRYMRCPECNKKSWQKKTLTKD